MFDSLYLASRYLAYNKTKTSILVISLTLVAFLPFGLEMVVRHSATLLRQRAATTPLIVGAKASELELVLSSLYFESDPPPTIEYRQLTRVRDSGLASAIGLHTEFRSQGFTIVGTSLDYFSIRGLQLEQGQLLTRLGDCVIGSAVAEQLEIGPGDSIRSTPEELFDIAGAYPLEMRVTGVLAKAGTPDDRAVFVDIKTCWVIAGLGHGHDDLSQTQSEEVLLSREGNTVTASAAVYQFNRITAENVKDFHFHGQTDDFPISAVLVFPHDTKSKDLLQGRYLKDDDPVQIVRPEQTIESLLETVLRIKQFVIIGALFVGLSTLLTAATIVALSLRLRARELQTMKKIGCSTTRLVTLIAIEIGGVLIMTALASTTLVVVSATYGEAAIRWFLL